MAERMPRRTGLLLASGVALALLAPAPAPAATTVAKAGDLELRARQSGGRLCLTMQRKGRYQGRVCGRIPRSPHRALRIWPDVGFNNYAAAVPPSVRTAETESRRGVRARHPTFASRGFAARFVLIPAPPSAVLVRFHGADGALLAVDPGPAGYITFENETPIHGEPGRGIDAHTEPWLEPLPGDPGRLRTLACIHITTSRSGGENCDQQAESVLVIAPECRKPDLVGAIVPGGVASVRLTLGSGAGVDLPARDLPGAFGGRRTVAGLVPAGEAVREAAALDATGAVVARAAVGTEPGGQPCAGEDRGGSGFSGMLVPASPPPGAVTVAAAAGEVLLAADQGDTLCVGLGPLVARVCPPPPVDSDRPRLLRRGGVVAGALSHDAARVTLQLDRGGDVTVPATDGAAYTGRWAGRVRFFAASIGAGRAVRRAVVRDAGGTIIGISRRGVQPGNVRRRVLAEQEGMGIALVRREGDPPCMTAFGPSLPPAPSRCTDLTPGTPIEGDVRPFDGTVLVACGPRRALAYGRIPDRLTPPRVVLADGRRVRPRRIALVGKDGWVAFLPDAGVRGLRSGDHRVRLALPPASAQCGYPSERTF